MFANYALKVKRSNLKAAVSAALTLFRPFVISCLILSSISFFVWFRTVSSPALPSTKNPILLYSEQCGDDLKSLFLSAIYSAKTSIFILIYGLTDPEIIQALNEKYAQGVELRVFYDKGGSKNLSKQLPLNTAFAVKTSGLMHKKVLCIDDHLTFLGSANLTETSLRLHDNLVVAVEYQPLSFSKKIPLF